MDFLQRAQDTLEFHFTQAVASGAPPRLVEAMRHAVFSAGARVRAQLVLAVAVACGEDAPELTDAAACAVELMHCASLVHDDMPAFDNADMRRGLPTVHKAFGEPLALLAGDALIVMAYQVLLSVGQEQPQRLLALLRNLSAGVGLPAGIVAGQAWECEANADLKQYQCAKTGSLFVAATCAGALCCGSDARAWVALGANLGLAYQVADDIRDVLGQAAVLGKPVGQDALHARPSAVSAFGFDGALAHFKSLIGQAVNCIPACSQREALQQLVQQQAKRLVPSVAAAQYQGQPDGVCHGMSV